MSVSNAQYAALLQRIGELENDNRFRAHIAAIREEYSIVAVSGQLADISTADKIYIPALSVMAGEIVEVRAVIDAPITLADSVITLKIGGVTVTDASITVSFSGSAAGDTFVSYPSADRTVFAGGSIEIETDGASTSTVKCMITLLIKRL